VITKITHTLHAKQHFRLLPFKVIKTKKQYYHYRNILDELTAHKNKNRQQHEIIELLQVLIEKWEKEHSGITHADPVELLKWLMAENKIKSVELALILGISKSMMSVILNYRRGLSKKIIRKLASHFNLSQEAFNKPYNLVTPLNTTEVIPGSNKLFKAG